MVTAKDFSEWYLDNGLYVGLMRSPTRTIAGRLRVGYGGMHDPPGKEGLAHFMEHVLMTSGGKNYGGSKDVKRFTRQFGYYNAETNIDNIAFPVDMLPQSVEPYLAFISDLVFEPRFDSEDIEVERRRVIRELTQRGGYHSQQMLQQSPAQAYHEALYGNEHEILHATVTGKPEIIANLKKEDLQDAHQRGYFPRNMDLILVGNLPENIGKLVEFYFGQAKFDPRTRLPRYELATNSPLEQKIEVILPAPDLQHGLEPNAEIHIGIVGPGKKSEEKHAFSLLSRILGGGSDTTRLYERLSHQEGLAYFLHTHYCEGSRGVMETQGQVLASRVQDALGYIFEEFRHLKEKPVSAEELQWAKGASQYEFSKALETNSGLLAILEKRHYDQWDFDDALKKIDDCTAAELQEVAQKYLPSDLEADKYALLVRNPLLTPQREKPKRGKKRRVVIV